MRVRRGPSVARYDNFLFLENKADIRMSDPGKKDFRELNSNWFESGLLPPKKSKVAGKGLDSASQMLLRIQFPVYRFFRRSEEKCYLTMPVERKKKNIREVIVYIWSVVFKNQLLQGQKPKRKKGMWRLDNKIKFLTFNTKAGKRKAPESTIRKVLTQISIAISYPMCEIESLQDLNFNFGIYMCCTTTYRR